MIIQQKLLRDNAQNFKEKVDFLDQNESLQSDKKMVFLCHSHEDKELVLGLKAMLQQEGLDIYLDWEDYTMPFMPDAETALKLQEKIDQSDIFFYLATNNSMKSTWCPWEIGYADAINKDILIIPTTIDGIKYYGNEYLELYRFVYVDEELRYFIHYPKEGRLVVLNNLNLKESKNG